MFPHPVGVFCALLEPPKCHIERKINFSWIIGNLIISAIFSLLSHCGAAYYPNVGQRHDGFVPHLQLLRLCVHLCLICSFFVIAFIVGCELWNSGIRACKSQLTGTPPAGRLFFHSAGGLPCAQQPPNPRTLPSAAFLLPRL